MAEFFPTPKDFRRWLAKNHAKAAELVVGYYKKDSGKPSITWPESVDEALCFGWIDGVRKGIDDESYQIRFTPRKPTSNWSAINIARVKVLTEEGRMTEAGLAAFARRSDDRSAIYSYEQETAAELSPEQLKRFKADKKAWKFFSAQAPWYQRTTTHWVVRAKKEETREKRLLTLIADSAAGRTVAQYTRTPRATRTRPTRAPK